MCKRCPSASDPSYESIIAAAEATEVVTQNADKIETV